ncbi:NUDIX domain-containing protein [Corynebacterium sp. TAE3-ERU12]|uniref:NUDIX hydrolase n=1 Tax=Corynebacterium sp. TAE3-ERU12 TaxID=2849491 RepID=UPI001C445BF7|nr:NUDIX hydrolase [Corynebacterium sp. TAE3-ERU12]MBV7294331.1 NUDIX domain-containing protein [Corynebacterium sp. TAE3-ERU12]
MTDTDGAGPKNGPRRRRRRPRRRGGPQQSGDRRGQRQSQQGSGAASSAPQEAGDKAAQPGEQPKQNKNQGGGNRKRRNRGGPNKGQRGQNQNRNRSGGGNRSRSGGRNGGNNRNAKNRNQAKGRSHNRNQSQPQMPTSVETSAGGLVISGLAEAVDPKTNEVDMGRIYVALIGRLDRRGRLLWSMPKGHVEPGEGHGATAEREVWEETGIRGATLAELGVIDYWFVSEGKRIHKTVHHHLLRYIDGDLDDEDPEVTEVQWVPVAGLVERLAYADERKLARRAHDILPDLARAECAAGRLTPR